MKDSRHNISVLIYVGIFFACVIILWAGTMSWLTGVQEPRRPLLVNRRAKSLQMAGIIYARDHRGRFPPTLAALFESGHVKPAWLVSPHSGTDVPGDFSSWSKSRQREWIAKHASYVLVPGLTNDLDPNRIALFQKPLPGYDAIAVAYNDNHVGTELISDVEPVVKMQTGKTIAELVAESEKVNVPASTSH